MKLSFRQKLQVIKAYKESGGKDPLYSVLSKFENGGDLPEKSPTIVDNKLEDDNLVGMMKARMAMASQFGNTSAQRMTSVSPKTYQFTGNEQINGEYIGVPKGEVGTHFMSSMDNYAVPFIQERDGNMQFISNPSYKDSEAMRFDRPYDAEYFAEHYKDITPMMQSFENGGKLPSNYKISKNDTLTSISKKYNIPIDDIAAYNGIKDPNLIIAGNTLSIPKVYDRELKMEEIPQTHHKNIVIDNYSKRYDYIVQGDKTYYRVKNGNTWKDISDNPNARKNLYNFLDKNYNLKGYSDKEKVINSEIKNGTYNYDKLYESDNDSKLIWNDPQGVINSEQQYLTEYNKPYNKNTNLNLFNFWNNSKNESEKHYLPLPLTNTTSTKQPNANFNANLNNLISKNPDKPIKPSKKENTIFDNVYDLIKEGAEFVDDKLTQLKNGVQRRLEKTSDEVEPITKFEYKDINTSSKYEIRRPQLTGDTVRIDKNRYYIPEVIDLSKVKLNTRNRGDFTPIKTDGAIITAFNPFMSFESIDRNKVLPTDNFIGINSDGKFKVGNYKDFDKTYKLTKTFKNTVIDFVRDSKGEIVYTKRNKDNPNNPVPNVRILNDDGKEVIGSLNILTKRGSKDAGTYGQITGGRTIMKAGNETLLVSGSMVDIEKQFNRLKSIYGKVDIYTLDNGSYVRALRTYNKSIDRDQLKAYDLQNTGGGNFAYLDGNPKNSYKETIYQTPNIRTKDDESFKKGHPIVNERKGIVLHHTAYTEPSLDAVHKYFMTPKNNSAHAVINYDGSRNIYAKPEQVTFHAGESKFKGRDNVNDFMIGLEFQGDTNKKHLTEDQIYSAVEYLYPIILQNNIPLENIVTHHQVAGERKPDINEQDYNAIISILKEMVYRPKGNKK